MTSRDQTTLRTDRLVLVPLADEHLEHEIALDADPEVMRFLGSGRARTRGGVADLHRDRVAPSEGAREVIRYGFEDMALDRIFAETMAVNAASRATMTSVGMQ